MSKAIYDVAIIGGGPAGAATACYLAMAGLDCVVLEREEFPRDHVGESLVPSTTRVLRELGLLEQMEKMGFPRKYGAGWTVPDGSKFYGHDWEDAPPEHRVDIKFQGVVSEQTYTYHVDRSKFDKLLLDRAADLGATVLQRTRVSNVEFQATRVVLDYKDELGSSQSLRASMVVDASGRRTFLGSRLKLKVPDPNYDQYALHTWMTGFERGSSDKADYIWIHFLPEPNSWIWQIPISKEVTSFGIVTRRESFVKARSSRDAFFWEKVRNHPNLFSLLEKSKIVKPWKAEGNYSYSMASVHGDRFVLVGDSARFVDPIFSSGVSIALNGARFASQDIIRAAKTKNFAKDAFETYSVLMANGCRHWYEFIRLYYRLNVLFTYFVEHPKHRPDILKLLQGDVYENEEPAVLQSMRKLVKQVEENPSHIWHQLLV